MASIRSNLNSVPSVTNGLTALRKRITTCFQHWRRKSTGPSPSPSPQQRGHHRQDEHHHHQQHFFYSEQSFHVFKTTHGWRQLNTRLKSLFASRKSQPSRASRSGAGRQGEPVEIVAKLLSSTLLVGIAAKERSSDNMTITDDTFLRIRDEYPDLEAEIRSILMARAQEGTTIAEIREDYKKITGMSFPIYENITDFLLSIPSVSAVCNERGTRIFSIVPTEKTKHLYSMVLEQKPPVARPAYAPYGRSRGLGNRPRPTHRPGGRIHYHSANFYHPSQNYNYANNNNNNNYVNHSHYIEGPQAQYPRLEKNSERSDSTESVAEYNCYYEDNYNYLNSRFHAQQPLVAENNFPDCNNNNEHALDGNNLGQYNKNLAQYTDLCSFANHILQQEQRAVPPPQQQQPQQQQQQDQKRVLMTPFRQPRPSLPGRVSSPTGTRSSQNNESMFTTDSDYEAHLLDFPLLGDDFFLYLARMELKCKFKKYEKVLQSGLCVSGQTIGAAIKRVRKMANSLMHRRVIVNIGSVDIMQGKPLVQIEHEFRQLLNTMQKIGLTPILTTLAPLANLSHITQIKDKLERFNEFIKREGQNLLVIDVWSCLVNEKRQTLFDCFQNGPRNVTGVSESYVFWNKIGRQRVLQLIEANIEY